MEIGERIIVESDNFSNTIPVVITEYNFDGIWREVHREDKEVTSSDFGEVIDSFTNNDGTKFRNIYKPKPIEKQEIWFKNNSEKGLPHFSNTTKPNNLEPVFKSLAEANFYNYDDDINEIIESPELRECLNRIEDNIMYFNFNWDFEKKVVIPLRSVLNLMDKKINVDICFHDKEGVVMYKVKLSGFKFIKIHDLKYYDWSDNGIKELKVEYSFDEENVII